MEEYTGRRRRYDSFYYQNDWLDGAQFQECSGPNRCPELWPHLGPSILARSTHLLTQSIVQESEYEEYRLRKAFRRKYHPYSDGRASLSDKFLRDRRTLEGHLGKVFFSCLRPA